MEKIINKLPFRTDEFDVVNKFPHGYVLWNIGRENFPFPGFIPLAKPTRENMYYIELDTLKALRIEDEDLCLHIIREGHSRWINEPVFFRIIKDWRKKNDAVTAA